MFRSLIVTALFAFAGAANSAVLYTYQGQPFTSFEGDFSWLGGTPTAITGFILLDQPLPYCSDYCGRGGRALLDFRFSDGITTYTLADVAALPRSLPVMDFITNEAGDIEYWAFEIFPYGTHVPFSHFKFGEANFKPVSYPSTFSQGFGGGGATYYCGPEDGSYGCFDSNPVAFSAGPGTWTTTVVPIPAAVLLFGSALGLIGVMRRKISS